jgi:hypothetical protein
MKNVPALEEFWAVFTKAQAESAQLDAKIKAEEAERRKE